MSDGVKARADRIAAIGRYAAPNPDRQLNVEAALRLLADQSGGRSRDPEAWDDFLRRIGVIS